MSNKELIAKYREGYKKGFLDGAEPEQTEQEPVGVVRTIGGYPDNSQHTVELTGRHGDLRDGDLLYLAPPKREPLSDEEIVILGVQNLCNEANSFKPFGFARAIEKAHGITGGGE